MLHIVKLLQFLTEEILNFQTYLTVLMNRTGVHSKTAGYVGCQKSMPGNICEPLGISQPAALAVYFLFKGDKQEVVICA